jgi:hypothetical protein
MFIIILKFKGPLKTSNESDITYITCHLIEYVIIGQGSQTRGPPDAFVRTANILKTDKKF